MTPPRGGAKKLTKAQMLRREERIIKDIKAGKLSYREIAAKHSVSLPTVNNKARKAGISRGRRKGARILVSGPRRKATTTRKSAVSKVRRKAATRPTRKATRKPMTRSVRAARSSGGFAESFRELVLKHYPNISLKQFDRLNRMIEKEIS